MKKTTLIGCLLVIACLLSACSKVSDDSRIPVYDYTLPAVSTESTSAPQQQPSVTITPSNPEDLIGKWYSNSAATAFEFFNDQTAKIYYLAPGYYEYESIEDGTYTYDGVTLSCKFPSQSNFTFSCSVNQTELNLTVSYQTLKFEPVTEMPTEHPKYDFPNFDLLVKDTPISFESYFGTTIETDITKESIQQELSVTYWKSAGESDRVKLDSGTAKLGDLVNIDYEGKLNGVAFSGGTATNQTIEVNDGTGYIDGFCIGVVGHSVGETFDVEVTFPENYGSSDLAGKEVVFTMKLNCIYAIELTDEIATEQGYDTVEAWVNDVYETRIGELLWEKVEDLKTVELPEEAYQFFYQNYLDNAHYYAWYYFENDLDAYLQYVGITLDSMLEECKEIARKFYQSAQIVDKHQLTADETLTEELRKEYLQSYIDNGYSEEEANDLLEKEGQAEFLAQLEKQLAERFFVENNSFSAPEN